MAVKRILSGMRPTGKLHIGHYVGALESWVSFPSETGKREVTTIKLNYVFKF